MSVIEGWLDPYRWRYYATAALYCGVPVMWLEDAAQDIALACWRAQQDTPVVVHRAAVNAGRRYGAYRQYGDHRVYAPATVALSDAWALCVEDRTAVRDALIDAQAAIARLQPQYRREIARQLVPSAGRRAGRDYKRGQHARARLRQLCA